MDEKNETFNYTYSAQQQEEIKSIRKKYAAPEEDKMELLRQLDRRVTQKAQAWAIAPGVLGVLLLGVGMCCCMVWGGNLFIPGTVVGIVGILLICSAYPLYIRVTAKERKKVAPEIIRLTDDLLK